MWAGNRTFCPEVHGLPVGTMGQRNWSLNRLICRLQRRFNQATLLHVSGLRVGTVSSWSRTITFGLLDKMFCFCIAVTYYKQHCVYTSVPFFHLRSVTSHLRFFFFLIVQPRISSTVLVAVFLFPWKNNEITSVQKFADANKRKKIDVFSLHHEKSLSCRITS